MRDKSGTEQGRSRRWRDFPLAAVWFALILAFLVLQVSPILNPVSYDESNLVYDAARLNQGQVPYRDFFCFLPPNALYFMAALHPLMPDRPETAERYLVISMVFLACVTLFLALRKVGLKLTDALLVVAIFPLCLYPYGPFALHHWLGDASYLFAIAVAALVWKKPESGFLWYVLGFLVGTTGCFLQTTGAFALVLLGLTLLTTSEGIRALMTRVAKSMAGLVLSFGLFVGPLVVLGAGKAFFFYVYRWTFMNYRHPGNINDNPFLVDFPARIASLWQFHAGEPAILRYVSAISGTALYFLLLGVAMAAVAASVFLLWRTLKRKEYHSPALVIVPLITLVTFGAMNFTGPGWLRLTYMLVPDLFLWAILLALHPPGRRLRSILRVGGYALLVLALLSAGARLIQHPPKAWELTDVDRPDRDSPLDVSLRKWSYLQPGDTIAVMPTGGNVYLYTYPAAIGYTYFFPLQDRYNDLEDHRIVARQIERNKPAAVLIHKMTFKEFMAPDDPVSAVLKSCYHRVGETPVMVIMVRNALDGKCAQLSQH